MSLPVSSQAPLPPRRERPWLFPSNRRLRHLQAISVRNLVVAPPSRSRAKAIDDEDIPNSRQSPSKILAQEAVRPALHQSRSFTSLSSSAHAVPRSRPGPPAVSARRNTLPWSDPNPRTRQAQLEDITRSRMADTWVSIHCDASEPPVYVSEVVGNATNPSFHAFDLNLCGPLVARCAQLTVKLWAKTVAMEDYELLVELQLALPSLQFLGKSLDSFHQPLPANSVLFHFPDGVYANLTDLPPTLVPLPARSAMATDAQPSSSYDALMRLANLDECIQDALATRENLEAQITSILEQNQRALTSTSDAARAREKLASTRQAVAVEKKQLRRSTARKDDLIASLRTRRDAMKRGSDHHARIRSHLPDAQSKLASSATLLDQNTDEAKGQLRRIAEDLLGIYPIEPIPDRPLQFTIAGIALPNSNFTDVDREAVAAALGHTARLVYLLSFYLSVTMPYPIDPNLPQALIQDPLSVALPQRTYPLYPVSVQYRFEYGVFLLNKDIEFLLAKQGLRVLDIRHTLPNLKYLLYVLTAGTAAIPARKAGGIRGLPGRLGASVVSSRRGSEASDAGSVDALPRQLLSRVAQANGEVTPERGKQGGMRAVDAVA